MKYYYVMYDYENERDDVLIADSYKLYGISDYEFWNSNKIKWDKRNMFFFEKDGSPDDYLAHVHPSAEIVSQKIKDILETELNVGGLQFFPIPLKHTKSDKVIYGYYVMNVTNLVRDALNREKSIFSVTPIGKPPALAGVTKRALSFTLRLEKFV